MTETTPMRDEEIKTLSTLEETLFREVVRTFAIFRFVHDVPQTKDVLPYLAEWERNILMNRISRWLVVGARVMELCEKRGATQ